MSATHPLNHSEQFVKYCVSACAETQTHDNDADDNVMREVFVRVFQALQTALSPFSSSLHIVQLQRALLNYIILLWGNLILCWRGGRFVHQIVFVPSQSTPFTLRL